MKCVIGISGLAGDGKDSAASILRSYLKSNYFWMNCFKTSLADELKKECKPACLDLYGIDPISCSREDKEKIRDMIVFYGKVKRLETEGQYWTSKLEEKIIYISNQNKENFNVFFVPDIRYATFKNDEVAWLKSQENSVLIHVKKYKRSFCQKTNKFIKTYSVPVNKEEAKNCPATERLADFIIEWEDKSPTNPENDSDCASAVNYVAKRIFDPLVESWCPKMSNFSKKKA